MYDRLLYVVFVGSSVISLEVKVLKKISFEWKKDDSFEQLDTKEG